MLNGRDTHSCSVITLNVPELESTNFGCSELESGGI